MSTLFKRSNGFYYVVSLDRHGRRQWKSTGEKLRDKAYQRIASLTNPDVQEIKPPTLSVFTKEFTRFASTIYAKGTMDIYNKTLKHFLEVFGNQNIDLISARHIDLFRLRRHGQVSPTTLNIELRTLRAAFTYAVRWNMLKANPFTRVPLCQIPEQTPMFFSPAEFKVLVLGINQRWLRSMVILAACTGMRRGELVNLTWNDVDLGKKVVRIQSNGSFKTKWGKKRIMPLNEIAMRLISDLAQERVGEYVFNISGRKVRLPWVTRSFKKHIRRLGLNEDYHFHHLRHTFASWLAQNGAPLYEIQKLMGHSSIRVTEIYSHLAPEQLHGTVGILTKHLALN